MSNPDRVAVAEGKRPSRSVSVPRPVLSQVQGLQQRTGSMNSQLGQVGQLGPQQISQDPFHQFVHQQQLAMGLAPKSLSELQMINPGLIHSLHQAYAAATRGTQQPPPNLSQLLNLSQTQGLGQYQPPTSSHSVPSLPIPTTTISPDVDDDASALLAMIGGAIDDDTEISVLPAALDTALDTTNTSSNESTVVSDDVTDLFAILEGATGNQNQGAGSSSSSFNNHHNIPICSANLSKAFQGNTAQLLQSLQVRDEERVVGPLYSGKQDEKTGHRFPNQPKYEAQISFNYHITQREKMLNQADLMRRWNLPFSHWIAQPSPYHTVGNEFIQYKPEQKMRDPYMTTDEAAKIAAGGGVIVGGEASLAAQVPPSLSELLSRTTNNIEGDLFDEKSNGDSNNQNNLENKMDTEGIYYIPVDGLREHETKQCVVCQETFESVFDDAADRWVYKPTRRVPAGLLHSHCWTQESESFVNKTETSDSSSKKRSLDDEENENDSEEGEPSLKRTKT